MSPSVETCRDTDVLPCLQALCYAKLIVFFPGQQLSATGRTMNPGEKPPQQVEPVNSNLKAKKLRPDESLSDGFITVLPQWFRLRLLMQDGSPEQESVWIFSLLLSCLYLSQPVALSNFPPLRSPLSGLSLWGGEGGSASLRPEESCSEESPWWWRAEGSRCWTPHSPHSLPLRLSSVSVWKPRVVSDISICVVPLSNPAALESNIQHFR